MRKKKQNQIFCLYGLLIVALTITGVFLIPVYAVEVKTPLTAQVEASETDVLSIDEIQSYIERDGVDYYAYMVIDEAPAELHPIILEARSRIIYGGDTGWVADNIDGCIKDEDGNIIEVLPHFHDIFPDDWELPPRYVAETNE